MILSPDPSEQRQILIVLSSLIFDQFIPSNVVLLFGPFSKDVFTRAQPSCSHSHQFTVFRLTLVSILTAGHFRAKLSVKMTSSPETEFLQVKKVERQRSVSPGKMTYL